MSMMDSIYRLQVVVTDTTVYDTTLYDTYEQMVQLYCSNCSHDTFEHIGKLRGINVYKCRRCGKNKTTDSDVMSTKIKDDCCVEVANYKQHDIL